MTEAIHFDTSNWNFDQIVFNRKDYEGCAKLYGKYFVELKEIFVLEAAQSSWPCMDRI